MKKITLVLLALVSLVILFFILTIPNYLSDNSLSERNYLDKKTSLRYDFFYCEFDDDCVMVREDCCGCSSGGKAISVNKQFKEEWVANISASCDGGCIAVGSDDISCFSSPICQKNKCSLNYSR